MSIKEKTGGTEPKNTPTDQFRRLMCLLQDHGIEVFPDSGTLLFLHREGSIPSYDKDIDLAVLSDAIPGLLSLNSTFNATGYRVKVNRYRGIVYTIALKPLPPQIHWLPVAIHIYFQDEDSLLSPQVRKHRALSRQRRTESNVEQNHHGLELRTLGRRLRNALRALTNPIDRSVLVERWPLNRYFEGSVWNIPRSLILPLKAKEYAGIAVRVPNDVEAYLAARYGDWRIPRASWSFWLDDGLITSEHPRNLIGRLNLNGQLHERR